MEFALGCLEGLEEPTSSARVAGREEPSILRLAFLKTEDLLDPMKVQKRIMVVRVWAGRSSIHVGFRGILHPLSQLLLLAHHLSEVRKVVEPPSSVAFDMLLPSSFAATCTASHVHLKLPCSNGRPQTGHPVFVAS